MPNDPIGIFERNKKGRIPGSEGTDENVKISDNDTTADHLDDKIVAGSGITLTVLNDGADEQLQIATSGIASDDEEIIVDFDHTSATPLPIATVTPAGTITRVRIIIDTAFDGIPLLTVGITGQTALYMQSDESDPTVEATYEVSALRQQITSGTVVNLYLNLTFVTQGEGRVILNITR